MATQDELTLTWENGNYGGDDTRIPAGFVLKMVNAILHPDDYERPWKIPGRSLAAAFPTGVTAATAKGLAYCRFPNNDLDKLLLLGANAIYAALADTITLGPWTALKDQQATPAVFARTGSFLKALPTGDQRYILFTGDNTRPLVLDEDGNVRHLSLNAPGFCTATAITVVPAAPVRPAAFAQSATTIYGPPTGTFDSPALAYDADVNTCAFKDCVNNPAVPYQIISTDWTFTPGAYLLGCVLKFQLGMNASASHTHTVGFGGPHPLESVGIHTQIVVAVSTDTGTTWSYMSLCNRPGRWGGQIALASTQARTAIIVRVTFCYDGLSALSGYVYDISAVVSTSGAPVGVPPGTYSYAVTEQYSQLIADGSMQVVESAPSEVATITLTGTANYGVVLTLPAAAQSTKDGLTNAPPTRIWTRNIYRTASTGTYPDLGRITSVPISATTYNDAFDTPGTTLGAPGLNICYIGDGPFPIAGQPAAFIDATLHKGTIVYIPFTDPTQLAWSAPGAPEYYPLPHSFGMLPVGRGESGVGIISLGDNLIFFSRTRVHRIRELPMATSNNFDLTRLETDVLSHNEGLAGSPLSYVLFQMTEGQAACAWVSYSGIWLTDGYPVAERGVGCRRLTANKSWRSDVDLSRLQESRLTFDPHLQVIIFDYYNRDGELTCDYLHVSSAHWAKVGDDAALPKWSGPHTLTALGRAIGEHDNNLLCWDLTPTDVRAARSGTQDNTSDILTYIETGWIYPFGPRSLMHLYLAALGHSDWGASEACDIEIQLRNERTGIIQSILRSAISLRGSRNTDLGFLNVSGRALKVILRHLGKTTSVGTPIRAFGPLTLQVEAVDDGRLE